MNIKGILYWILAFFIISALWPLIKWLIVIVLVGFAILYFMAKKNGNVHVVHFDDHPFSNNKQIHNDDVIDVEVKERKVKDGTL